MLGFPGLLKSVFPAMRKCGLLVMILSLSHGQQPSMNDDKPCTWRHFKKMIVGNKAIRRLNLISSHNVHLVGECHILCTGHENCYGYNFRSESNIYSKNCQLSNSTITMNKTRKKNGTWTFYEDVLVTQDIDECSNKSSHDIDVNANCNNTPGSYECLCINGYSGDGRTCTDVNECSEGTHTCDENANCTNTDGSFNCNCQIGYTGDGNACTDVNECSSSVCHSNADCTNTVGSYTCQCRNGYAGSGQTCSDVNECSLGTHSCSLNADCSNTVGSYTCQCRSGYEGDGKSCVFVRIRLAGTAGVANKGRVEIYHPSYGWGTVCDDTLDLQDGHVICRQLGYQRATAVYLSAHYGQGTGLILLDDTQCAGHETYIWDCKHLGWCNHNCGHGEDSSVDCL